MKVVNVEVESTIISLCELIQKQTEISATNLRIQEGLPELVRETAALLVSYR